MPTLERATDDKCVIDYIVGLLLLVIIYCTSFALLERCYLQADGLMTDGSYQTL